MKFNNYAIIIGINDYTVDPLNYCANDAKDIMKALIEHARYPQEKIFSIISDSRNPIKDITGKYKEAIDRIKETFIPGEDSLFFYFAGHGLSIDNKSLLAFQDSTYAISSIFEDISLLNPKLQFYVIDACESGGKVLARKSDKADPLEKLIENSSGILFLYACQETEKALERKDIEHGVMTYHFLKAVKKVELYDEDGILTPGRIQEYVSKETARSSDFKQIPVIENRITGYYPFAYLATATDKNEDCKETENSNTSRNYPSQEISYSFENRMSLQKAISSMMTNKISSISHPIDDSYEILKYDQINKLPISNRVHFINSFVGGVDRNRLESIGDAIKIDKMRNPKYNVHYKLTSPILLALGEIRTPEPEYHVNYSVDESNDYLTSYFNVFRSNNIEKVSFCIGFIVYQAKWGIVLCCFYFLIDWDGETDGVAKDIFREYVPLRLRNDSVSTIEAVASDKLFKGYPSKVLSWNNDRMAELIDFEKRATIDLEANETENK